MRVILSERRGVTRLSAGAASAEITKMSDDKGDAAEGGDDGGGGNMENALTGNGGCGGATRICATDKLTGGKPREWEGNAARSVFSSFQKGKHSTGDDQQNTK